MDLFGESLTFAAAFFLLLALALALSFEFVNGFHDTANAVATVIYTNALKPVYAVVWSGCWNLIGVLCSTGAVAYGVVALLPVELVLNAGSGAGFAMIFSLLVSAIIWNVGTWYLGLPASSSHTLFGSIIGVGVANSLISGHGWAAGVNWGKAHDIGLALLISPIVGFVCSGLLLIILKFLVRSEELYKSPEGKNPPPLWIRLCLIGTCTGVSYAHGSNDGQKGMGLIMLILVGLVPGAYALNMGTSSDSLKGSVTELQQVVTILNPMANGATVTREEATAELNRFVLPNGGKPNDKTFASVVTQAQAVSDEMANLSGFDKLSRDDRKSLRTEIYLVDASIDKINKAKLVTKKEDADALDKDKTALDKITKYIPVWVKVAVALALGLGTMIGWKRIVVTVGEKIGKAHLTYAQGFCAELVAYATIKGADNYGWQVSTTHVLSSGIAGTMAANRSGLQKETLISILMAWVLTLPICVFLGATLFSAALYVSFHLFGMQ